MRKFKLIPVIIVICCLFSGCLGVPEVSRAYPVKDYIIVDEQVTAVFIVNEKEKTYSFEEHLIYSCEGESIVAALYWEHLLDSPEDANEIYLYLNETDYKKYREEIKTKREAAIGNYNM